MSLLQKVSFYGVFILLINLNHIFSFPDSPCNTENDGEYISNPESCDSYYGCLMNKWYLFTCPTGLEFDPVRNLCDWPISGGCAFWTSTTTTTETSTTDTSSTEEPTTTTTTTEVSSTTKPTTELPTTTTTVISTSDTSSTEEPTTELPTTTTESTTEISSTEESTSMPESTTEASGNVSVSFNA